MKNKRGDVSDGLMIVIVLFFLAVSFVAVAFINDKFIDVIQLTPLNDTTVSSKIVQSMENMTTNGIQQGFTFIFFGLCLGTILSSFLVRVHPGFLVLYIFMAGVTVILGALLGNAYNNFAHTTALENIAGQQTQIGWIMTHIVQIIIGVIGVSVLVLFIKFPGMGGESTPV